MVYLNEDAQRELIYEGEEVHEESNGSGRWQEYMTTVVRAEDGKLYRLNWSRGLTESQENDFEDGEVPEVFAVDSISARTQTSYLTADEQKKSKPTLAQKLEAESESYRIATGKELSDPITDEIFELASKLKGMLGELAPLDLAADSGAYRKTTIQYLEAITALKEAKSDG